MELRLPAVAKINLHLRVYGKGSGGYHNLDTSFVYVDVADTLVIHEANKLIVTCSEPNLNGEKNLVFRTLEALRRTFRVSRGLEVHVHKRIPIEAGLGGGSSDAATALAAANVLWRLNLERDRLIEFARTFGADIPAFLYGRASRARGIGDILQPLKFDPPGGDVVVAWPGSGLSTSAVFARFDADRGEEALELTPSGAGDILRTASRAVADASLPLGLNDLEQVACKMCPGLDALLTAMRAGGRRAWMSGSGTACVALVENAAAARELARALIRKGMATWTHAGRLLFRHPLDVSALKRKLGA